MGGLDTNSVQDNSWLRLEIVAHSKFLSSLQKPSNGIMLSRYDPYTFQAGGIVIGVSGGQDIVGCNCGHPLGRLIPIPLHLTLAGSDSSIVIRTVCCRVCQLAPL